MQLSTQKSKRHFVEFVHFTSFRNFPTHSARFRHSMFPGSILFACTPSPLTMAIQVSGSVTMRNNQAALVLSTDPQAPDTLQSLLERVRSVIFKEDSGFPR